MLDAATDAPLTPAGQPRFRLSYLGSPVSATRAFRVPLGRSQLELVLESDWSDPYSELRVEVEPMTNAATVREVQVDGARVLVSVERTAPQTAYFGEGTTKHPAEPVRLRITVRVLDLVGRTTTTREEILGQSEVGVLRQEYSDLGLGIPDASEFRHDPELARQSDYEWVLDRGIGAWIAHLRRKTELTVSSGYRNPRRNLAVNPETTRTETLRRRGSISLHLLGRAADLVPAAGKAGAAQMLALYRVVNREGRALLEHDGRQLLAGNQNVPLADDGDGSTIPTGFASFPCVIAPTPGKPGTWTMKVARSLPLAGKSVVRQRVEDPEANGGFRVVEAGIEYVKCPGKARYWIKVTGGDRLERGPVELRTPWQALFEEATHVHVSV